MNRTIVVSVLVCVIAAFFAPAAMAETSIDITTNKETFVPGDQVDINIKVTDTGDGMEDVLLVAYMGGVCTGKYYQQYFDMAAGSTEEFDAFSFVVDEADVSGTCDLDVEILDPAIGPIASAWDSFEIEDTLYQMELMLYSCRDTGCEQKRKVFFLNHKVYLDYYSSVADAALSATLTRPDGSSEQLSLPASITANQLGTYRIEATASKEGYVPVGDSEEFAVTVNAANISGADTAEYNLLWFLLLALMLVALFSVIVKKAALNRGRK